MKGNCEEAVDEQTKAEEDAEGEDEKRQDRQEETKST